MRVRADAFLGTGHAVSGLCADAVRERHTDVFGFFPHVLFMIEIGKNPLFNAEIRARNGATRSSTRAIVWLLTASTALLAARVSFGDETNTHRFEGKGGEFSIVVPTNWAEMDTQVIEALVDPYAEDQYAARFPTARYGYGPPMSDTIPDPPYIAIQVRKSGRMADRLVALQSKEDFLRTNVVRMLRKSGVLERNVEDTSYDTNKHMVRFSFTKIGPLVRDRLRVTNLAFFTEEGAINVTSVCSTTQWETWKGTIESAFASFQVADRLQYKPRGIAAVAERGSGFGTFLMTIGVFIVTPIVFMIYRRRAGDVMSDEI